MKQKMLLKNLAAVFAFLLITYIFITLSIRPDITIMYVVILASMI